MPGEQEHKRSSVWKFFTRENGTESSCNICDQVCKASGNTTNLRNHLKSKHFEAFKALCELAEDLDGVCAAARMEWGQCHSPDIDESQEGAAATVFKEITVKQEGVKRKYNKRKKKEVIEAAPEPIKPLKFHEMSSMKEEAEPEHDLDLFGRCIAAQLKKLSEKKAIMLTIEINNLVGEARIDDINEQLADKNIVTENPHVITVSYGDPLSNSSDNENSLEITHN